MKDASDLKRVDPSSVDAVRTPFLWRRSLTAMVVSCDQRLIENVNVGLEYHAHFPPPTWRLKVPGPPTSRGGERGTSE